ncbi:MAG: tetratricopeptide repeat protein [Planctomycetes bacterium]|nr:tetratricopeptide repeat protein [Planctomycetota bacterium]
MHLADFRPLVHFTLAINYAVSGLNVWSYHALNVAVHLASALTLFAILRLTPRRPALDAGADSSPTTLLSSRLAFAVALLWAVHPIQTQAVTYIIQRGESLMGLWYLLVILSVNRLGLTGRTWWGGLAVLFCAAGMFTKETMVTAPFVALMYDAVFLAGTWRGALRRRWPMYAAMGLTWGILGYLGLFHDILYGSKKHGVDLGFKVETMTPWTYLLTQPEVILHYLRLCLWPYPQCFDYGWQPVTDWSDAIIPGTVLLLLLVATLWAMVRRPMIGFLGAWVFVILSPTSSFIPIKDFAFEHRMYLPLATVLISVVLAAKSLWRRIAGTPTPQVGTIALVVAAIMLGGRTLRRNADYAAASIMWADVVAQRPTHVRAWNYYGVALAVEGRHDEAIRAYEKALALRPDSDDVQINLGKSLARVGRYAEAANQYRKALALSADDAMLHHSLAIALEKTGQLDAALAEYAETLRLDPSHPFARFNRGLALKSAGRWVEAESAFSDAVRVNPRDADARFQRATCLVQLKRLEEAVRELEETLRLHPDNALAKDLYARVRPPR